MICSDCPLPRPARLPTATGAAWRRAVAVGSVGAGGGVAGGRGGPQAGVPAPNSTGAALIRKGAGNRVFPFRAQGWWWWFQEPFKQLTKTPNPNPNPTTLDLVTL